MTERNPFEEITPGTPIKEFPGYYNQDIGALVNKINELEDAIDQKNKEINDMKVSFNSALNKLRSEYIAMLGADMPNEDGNYILKARKTGNTVEYSWVRSA